MNLKYIYAHKNGFYEILFTILLFLSYIINICITVRGKI